MQSLILAAPCTRKPILVRLLEQLGCAIAPSQWETVVALNSDQFIYLDQLNSALLETHHANWYHTSNIELDSRLSDQPYPLKRSQNQLADKLDRHGIWVSTDSAMCILLPQWREFLSNPVAILYIDHPMAVARRLQGKWRFPLTFGLALWEYYTRAAIINSEGMPRLVISHHQLLREPTEQVNKMWELLSNVNGKKLAIPNQDTLNQISSTECSDSNESMSEVADFANPEQLTLFEALGSGDTNFPILDRMSQTGDDILKSYGRLRTGYEAIERQQAETQKKLGEAWESLENQTRNDSVEKSVSGSDDGQIIELTVYLKNRPTLELFCERDNPIIDQLLGALVKNGVSSTDNGELFYLEFGEQTQYFPVSALLAVETSDNRFSERFNKKDDMPVKSNKDAQQLSNSVRDTKTKRVAVVVLGCLMPVYESAIDTIRKTWASRKHPNIDVYYVYGAHIQNQQEQSVIEKYTRQPTMPLSAFEVSQYGDVILCGCADAIQLQSDCLLRKRLIAFDYLTANFDYQYIYTVCASSYVDQPELASYVESLEGQYVFHGPVGVCEITGRPYVSGASMLFSTELIRELVKNKFQIIEDNEFNYADDVAIGSWIAEHISEESSDNIVRHIRSGQPATKDDTFVNPRNFGMINYVDIDVEDQRVVQNAYHYHFKADDMEQMFGFDRHFL